MMEVYHVTTPILSWKTYSNNQTKIENLGNWLRVSLTTGEMIQLSLNKMDGKLLKIILGKEKSPQMHGIYLSTGPMGLNHGYH